MPVILHTNDDGLASPGLAALRRVIDPLGTVVTLAPAVNCSAVARSITIDRPLRVACSSFGDGGGRWEGHAVEGTPVDCVRLATLGVLAPEPGVVIAGINLGANLGQDVTYSGTVGAAFEGLLLGLPAVAVSIDGRQPQHLRDAAAIAGHLIARALERGLPSRTLLNINLPDLALADIAGVRATTLTNAVFQDKLVVEGEECATGQFLIESEKYDGDHEPGTDAAAVLEGFVSVTPLHYDLTSGPGLGYLAELGLDEILAGARAAGVGRE